MIPRELFLIIPATFDQNRKSLFFFFFSIPPKKLNYADYFANFELCRRGIHKLQFLSAEDFDFIRTKTKDIALSSLRTHNNKLPGNKKSPFKNLTKVML